MHHTIVSLAGNIVFSTVKTRLIAVFIILKKRVEDILNQSEDLQQMTSYPYLKVDFCDDHKVLKAYMRLNPCFEKFTNSLI